MTFIQGFGQAFLSTAVFVDRFSFFSVYLVNYLGEVLPWFGTKEKAFEI